MKSNLKRQIARYVITIHIGLLFFIIKISLVLFGGWSWHPNVSANIMAFTCKAINTVSIIACGVGAIGTVSACYRIAAVTQSIIEDIFFSFGIELRIGTPYTIDETRVILSPTLKQAVAHEYVQAIKFANIEFTSVAIEDTVIEVTVEGG